MHTLRRIVVCVFLCSTAIAARPLCAQEVSLRYHWTKGEELRYRQTLQSTTTVSGTGLPAGSSNASFDSTMIQTFRTVVDDVAADGTATFRQTIESVRLEVNGPTGRTVFDTATNDNAARDPLSQGLSAVYSAMIGESVTIVTSPTGVVRKIDGMTRIFEKMMAAQPGGPIPAGALEGLKNSFSDEAMRDMTGRGFAAFPDRPLKPGDAWDEQFTTSVPMFGTVSTARTWTFQGIESRTGAAVARFTATHTIKTDPSKPASGAPSSAPSPIIMEPGGNTGDSDVLFDMTRGRLLSVTTHMTQAMTVSIPAANAGSAMSMRTIGKTTMLMELLDASSR